MSSAIPRALLGLVLVHATCAVTAAEEKRPRLRDLGATIGVFEPGQLNAITDVRGVRVEQTASAGMREAGYQQTSGDTTRINGLDAYVGNYQRTANNSTVAVRAAHIRSGDQTYIVAGVAAPQDFSGVQATFSAAIQTFRALSRQEADRIQPSRVDFHTVRAGETWTSIAAGPAGGTVQASTLAIMNGRAPESGPRAGERIRIVVGG
jgi:predicted Zn-dependent protease